MCSLAPLTIARRIQRGFTLVELLIVVIILAVLSSIVIPQFSSSTLDAKESALSANLSVMRSAIELYKAQHNGKNPGEVAATGATCVTNTAAGTGAAGSEDAVVSQLTMYSDIDGKTCNGVQGSASAIKLGPYLRKGIPQDPIKNDDNITAQDTGVALARPASGSEVGGWLYDTKSGQLAHNSYTYFPR